MAITNKGLQHLGFTNKIDFVLYDKRDGNGTYIHEWNSASPQPSVAEIEAAHTEWQIAWDAQAYARNRKAEYDQLNQFEMQFDDDRDSTTTWVDTINEIKGRHPK